MSEQPVDPGIKEVVWPTKTLGEGLAGYEHLDAVLAEVAAARQILHGEELTPQAMIVFGSTARQELRTIADDPEDPSDVDILVIVDDDTYNSFAVRARQSEAWGWGQSSAGATHISAKIPSVSGILAPTEVFVYSKQGVAQESVGDQDDPNTQRVVNAMHGGLLVTAADLPS